MFSHLETTNNAIAEFIQEISAEDCRNMHRVGVWARTTDQLFQGLRVNHTISVPVEFAGSGANGGGSCKGSHYADTYGSWDNAVVKGIVKITLKQHRARVSLADNHIHLASGTVCPLSSGTCLDVDGGQTFWDPLPMDQCGFNRYGVLYEGTATKLNDNDFNRTQTVYSLTSNEVTFALATRGWDNVCGYTVTRTEHPRIVILETSRGETFTSNAVTVDNLDIFAYVNSKLVYVEKHIRTQMKNSYRDVLLQ